MRLFLVVLTAYGLSAADHIHFQQRVRMRDGVELSADVYLPEQAGKHPAIIVRTPYLKSADGTLAKGRYWSSHGYVFVAFDVRGRGDSGGEFIPYRSEGRDGYDSVEWCAAQPWSNGKVAMYGGSYLGAVQWLAAVEQPPHLVTITPRVTPSDPFVESPTGMPTPMEVSWYFFTSGHMLQNIKAVDWPEIHRHLPIYTMDEAIGWPNPHWKQMIDHAQLDSWWDPLRYQNKYDRVQVPVLHISGWYDDEQVGTPLNYAGMRAKGSSDEIRRSQKLLMGWWPHNSYISGTKLGDVDFGPLAPMDLDGYILRWFDYWMKGTNTGIMSEQKVRLFLMGANRWIQEDDWPIPRTQWTKYYFHSKGRANSVYGDGTMSAEIPLAEPVDRYASDPAQPVPFITEPSFAQIGGPDDYRSVERRDDVLLFSSDPMEKPTEVCGPIRVELYAASSGRDTDFMAKLIDVWPNGFAQRLSDGMVRARFRDGMDRPSLIEPDRIYKYEIGAWHTCQMFLPGHRIRVEIASTAFPKYDANPNTGEALGKTVKHVIANQRIYHDREHPSHVLLPIVP